MMASIKHYKSRPIQMESSTTKVAYDRNVSEAIEEHI
jgi:hypothetical protein